MGLKLGQPFDVAVALSAFEYDPGKDEFRSQFMLRWIFRIIAIAVAGKLLNQYLESRNPQRRQSQG
jgi:hypothetical protein